MPAGRVVTAEKERKGKQPSLPPPRTPTTATCPSTLISHTYTFKQALTHPLSAAVKHTSRTRQSERAGSKPRLQTCTESSARARSHTHTPTHHNLILRKQRTRREEDSKARSGERESKEREITPKGNKTQTKERITTQILKKWERQERF